MDWAALDTPFGPRTGAEIPLLVDKLDASNARVRARAVQDLHRRLVAVGGGYGAPFLDAALAAVPLIGERLRNPGVLEPQIGQLLAMLGDVAAGNHRLHLGRGLPADLDRDEIGPARATQAAVEELAETVIGLLAVEEPTTRAGAAFVLAWLPRLAASTRPALLERLAVERNAVARSAVLLALGYLRGSAEVLRASRAEKAPLGLCAALGAMLSDPAALDDDLDAVLAPVPKPVVKGLPFADGAVLMLRTAVLGAATVRRGDLDRHLALLDRLPPPLRAEAEGWTVLVAAHAGESMPLDPLDPADLSDSERAVLRDRASMLRSAKGPVLYQAFWRAGLFAYRDSNERALGIDPAGPLDRRSDGRPLWWWLHGVRSQRVALERWLEHLRGPDSLAVLEDAASAPYELYRDRFRAGGYDVEALIDVIERSATALGLSSALLEERLTTLRGYAADPKVMHGKGRIQWP